MNLLKKYSAFLLITLLATACQNNSNKSTKKITKADSVIVIAKQNDTTGSVKKTDYIVAITKKNESTDTTHFVSEKAEKEFTAFSNKIAPPANYFNIKSNDDTTLLGKKGTFIFVPRNCFVLKNGQIYKGNIRLKLKEVFDKSDMILSNLQTESNGKLLESGGMIYLDAKGANGVQLKIINGTSLYVEIPTKEKKAEMEVYQGHYSPNTTQINWTSPQPLEKSLIPVPIEFLNFTWVREATINYEENQAKVINALNAQIARVENIKYENTFVATREFQERFELAVTSAQFLYQLDFKKYGSFLNIYLNNLDKNLWYCDSLFYKTIQIEIKKMSKIAVVQGFKVDSWEKKQIESLYNGEHLGKVMSIKNYGINLSASNAYQLLIKKGINKKEALDEIRKYKIQQSVINEIRKKINDDYLTYPFNMTHLGWVNVDVCDYKGQRKDFFVQVKDAPNDIKMKAFIVLDKMNSVLSKGIEANTCTFYDFPSGQKKKIFIYGYKDGVPYFGYKDVQNGTISTETITLQKTTFDSLEKNVKTILSKS
ncbi:MAG TPA: hypothetical protein VNG53_03955 [Bacteroidia bacterium]|nr:hypothetical protein [Bacteroidia bacterium]